MPTPCKLCEKKRARRPCPGVGGEICAVCCGTERENTIDCPLDCEYLQEARQFERPALPGAGDLPNQDIRISEQFIRDHQDELNWMMLALARAMEAGKAVDLDAREALDALIRTYRTLEAGLIYETRPQNLYAAAIQQALQQSIEALRKRMAEELSVRRLRDADVLGTLVFLQRLEMTHNNGRRRGRAFLDYLRSYYSDPSFRESSAVSLKS